MSDRRDSQSDNIIINLRSAMTLPLLPFLSRVCAHLSLTRDTFDVFYHLFPIPFASPRGVKRAIARFLRHVLFFTALVQFILSGMSGITSHLASQAHTVAQNTHSITLAVCALPVPFKDLICSRIGNEPISTFNPNIDHSPAWHPFLINEDVHGPAVDFAIRKTANTTSSVLTLVQASDLSRRHEISDKLKDFLQRAWACEVTSGVHVALVKTAVDEMLLENDSVFAKLQVDLRPGLLSKLVTFNWARQPEHAILEALATAEDATTTHARRLVAHGESVYNNILFLESVAVDISSLLAAEVAVAKREKEEINARVSNIFGMHRGALRILDGRLADLHYISNLWREARDLLSLGIHVFNGIRSDLTALSEHQTSPKTARLHVPADQQVRYFKGWARRLETRRVLMPARVH